MVSKMVFKQMNHQLHMDGKLINTGLYKHFLTGCPAYQLKGDLSLLKWVLVDYLNTSAERLQLPGHVGVGWPRSPQQSNFR